MGGALPVVWTLGGGEPVAVGTLELLPSHLHFEGRRGSRVVVEQFRRSELGVAHLGRHEHERIAGRTTLVIEREGSASTLLVSAVLGLGSLAELIDWLVAAAPGL